MRRRILTAVAAATLVSLLTATPAAARTLPSLFARQVRAVNAARHAPAVLLPRSMPLDARHLYPAGGPAGSGYDLSIGAVARCGGADACFVAEFMATTSPVGCQRSGRCSRRVSHGGFLLEGSIY